MAQQTVGVGTAANDGTGDAPRTAGQKINSNFDELYAAIASLTSSVAGKANTSHTQAASTISDSTVPGRALLTAADAAAQRTALGLGTSSVLDVGTTASKVVQLTADAKLPAVDGSLLTGVVASGSEPRYHNVANNTWAYAGAIMSGNTAGSTCLFAGQLSGEDAVTVTDSTTWGIWALKNLVTGNGCSAFGVYALRDAVTLDACSAFGDSALMKTLASHNSGFGYGAGSRNLTGVGNNFFGSYSGWRGDKGDYNFIAGFYANSYTTGTDEEGVTLGDGNWIGGYYGAYKYQGNHSKVWGYEAAYNLVTGDHNWIEGYHAGSALLTGAYNIFLGYGSGSSGSQKTDAINSIAIGKDSFTTKDNQVVLGGPENAETVLTGSVIVPSSAWHKSSDTKERLFFDTNASSYYRGHTAVPHIFQNKDGGTMVRFTESVHEFTVEQIRVINSGASIALWKDGSPSRAASFGFGGTELVLRLYDGTAWRNGMFIDSNGSEPQIAFYGSTAVSKQTISGSRGGNAALQALLTALANLGLVTDSTS